MASLLAMKRKGSASALPDDVERRRTARKKIGAARKMPIRSCANRSGAATPTPLTEVAPASPAGPAQPPTQDDDDGLHLPPVSKSTAKSLRDLALDILTSPQPYQALNDALDKKSTYLQMAEDEAFPHNTLLNLEKTMPAEIALAIHERVVHAHWLRTRPYRNPGAQTNPVAKFLMSPRNIAVNRGIVSPSIACPDFLPQAALDNERARLRIGQAFLREADFVFVEPFFRSSSCGEMEWFRGFVATFSDERASGFAMIRSLTFPGFTMGHQTEALRLVRDSSGLKELTLGFSPEFMIVNRYSRDGSAPHLEEVDFFMNYSGMVRLYTTSLNVITLVKGCGDEETSAAVSASLSPWLEELARKLKASFIHAGKPSVEVWIDEDVHWDAAGPGQKRQIFLS